MAKKQTKKEKNKESWVKKYILVYIGILTILFGFIIIKSYYNSTPHFCSQNPDKCVCEKTCNEWYLEGDNYFNPPKELIKKCDINSDNIFDDIEKRICILERKKTQAELDIFNCIGNPREDKNCECIEWEKKGPHSGYLICKRSNETGGSRKFEKISELEYNQLLDSYTDDCDQGLEVSLIVEKLCSKANPKEV